MTPFRIDSIENGRDSVEAGKMFDKKFGVSTKEACKAIYPRDREMAEDLFMSFRNTFIAGWIGGKFLGR